MSRGNDSLADKVVDYFVALIVGVILLYVLFEVVKSLAADLPEILQWGIPIVGAAGAALVILAKKE